MQETEGIQPVSFPQGMGLRPDSLYPAMIHQMQNQALHVLHRWEHGFHRRRSGDFCPQQGNKMGEQCILIGQGDAAALRLLDGRQQHGDKLGFRQAKGHEPVQHRIDPSDRRGGPGESLRREGRSPFSPAGAQGGEHLLLAGEMMIKPALGHGSSVQHILYAGFLIPLLAEQPFRRVEQLLTLLVALAHGSVLLAP